VNWKIAIIAGSIAIVIGGFVIAVTTPLSYNIFQNDHSATQATSTSGFQVTHIKTPAQVKGIYMSSWVGGSHTLREKLVHLIDTTELNAVVLDIKDYTGRLSYIPDDPELAAMGMGEDRISDIKEFIGEMHDKGIYVIGRLSTFQDPYFVKIHPEYAVKTKSGAVWQDRKGIKWLDAGAEPVWNYFVKLSQASYDVGFDEINFDYIRFPTDGNMSDISYTYGEGRTKAQTINDFFKYVDTNLRGKHIPISADLFGLVTTSTGDLGIGQVLENGLAHFDFISPMVYPSHYPLGFNGWKNPNTVPYDLIKYVMGSAVKRAAAMTATSTASATAARATSTEASTTLVVASTTPKYARVGELRPWLQDFNLGGVKYTPEMVRAQITASHDVGIDSWLLWNASNVYSAAALLPQ
jgi:hypothetical protein